MSSEPASFTLGPVVFDRLPNGLGSLSGPTEYENDDISFVSATWETGNDASGWSTDLLITVMSGDRITDVKTLHDWFVAYAERPVEEASYTETTVNGEPGYVTADQIFWLLRPGLAASVTIDIKRYTTADLQDTVESCSENA